MWSVCSQWRWGFGRTIKTDAAFYLPNGRGAERVALDHTATHGRPRTAHRKALFLQARGGGGGPKFFFAGMNRWFPTTLLSPNSFFFFLLRLSTHGIGSSQPLLHLQNFPLFKHSLTAHTHTQTRFPFCLTIKVNVVYSDLTQLHSLT